MRAVAHEQIVRRVLLIRDEFDHVRCWRARYKLDLEAIFVFEWLGHGLLQGFIVSSAVPINAQSYTGKLFRLCMHVRCYRANRRCGRGSQECTPFHLDLLSLFPQ